MEGRKSINMLCGTNRKTVLLCGSLPTPARGLMPHHEDETSISIVSRVTYYHQEINSRKRFPQPILEKPSQWKTFSTSL